MREDKQAGLKGPAFALGAAVLFGASTPFAKALLGAVNPWMMAALLYVGAGVGLLLIRLATTRGKLALDIQRADWPWLFGAIVFGGGIGPVLLMLGLSQTDAATSSLLLTLEGVFTALLAWVAFREHVTARLVWGMIAIAFGAGVLAWNGAPDLKHASGPLFIAGACLAWAIDNNLTRRIALNDATTIAMLKGLFAGGANLALALSVGAHLPIAAAAPAMLIGFLGYGLSLVLFVKALRELGAGRTSAYFAAAPFVGAMIALGFGAPASANLAVAALFMGAGVWLHLTEHHAHVHLHEEMHHTHEHVHDAHHQHVHQPEDPSGEPHTHRHHHKPLRHSHAHFPDLHHTHAHNAGADKA